MSRLRSLDRIARLRLQMQAIAEAREQAAAAAVQNARRRQQDWNAVHRAQTQASRVEQAVVSAPHAVVSQSETETCPRTNAPSFLNAQLAEVTRHIAVQRSVQAAAVAERKEAERTQAAAQSLVARVAAEQVQTLARRLREDENAATQRREQRQSDERFLLQRGGPRGI